VLTNIIAAPTKYRTQAYLSKGVGGNIIITNSATFSANGYTNTLTGTNNGIVLSPMDVLWLWSSTNGKWNVVNFLNL
jgi:hypothetical protein